MGDIRRTHLGNFICSFTTAFHNNLADAILQQILRKPFREPLALFLGLELVLHVQQPCPPVYFLFFPALVFGAPVSRSNPPAVVRCVISRPVYLFAPCVSLGRIGVGRLSTLPVPSLSINPLCYGVLPDSPVLGSDPCTPTVPEGNTLWSKTFNF